MTYIATISLTDLKIDNGIVIEFKSILKDGKEEISSGYCGSKIKLYDTHTIQSSREQLTLIRDFCDEVLHRIESKKQS